MIEPTHTPFDRMPPRSAETWLLALALVAAVVFSHTAQAFLVVRPLSRPTLRQARVYSSSSPSDPSVLDTIKAGGDAPLPPPPPRVELPLPQGYNRVEVTYCTGCRWMLRAAWIAQELLTTFNQDQLDEVAIQPGRSSGVFDIYVNNQLVWSRKAEGRFPEAKEVKQRVRDIIEPDRDLGHSDVGGKKAAKEG